jgi:hypothetical protein
MLTVSYITMQLCAVKDALRLLPVCTVTDTLVCVHQCHCDCDYYQHNSGESPGRLLVCLYVS